MRDDNAIVLDFLPTGRSFGKPEPIAQVIGEKYFALLEVVVKPNMIVKQGEKVYIGDGDRDKIERIKRKILPKDLTNFAKTELKFMVEKLVKENEEKFVSFFNNAQPINTRTHQLDLLPGIGKKHMWEIIKERKTGEFKTFEDIRTRVKLLPNPEEMIVKRIMQEIENENERFRLFTTSPPRRFDNSDRRRY